eukprot:TRINITY_DN1777_c0_g1_i1.p1 TRINITY_DN1777_c0_g1~~TRINITY_DN1777_c0_g1_i1.p1  ORF type:complete len:771 (+),score=221.22 TRINITY_DN1777_c0_g1_i1:2-2314(+)
MFQITLTRRYLLFSFLCLLCVKSQGLSASEPFWLEQIKHNGMAPFSGNPTGYVVFRNVKDYGAKGDGVADDSPAINAAIADGNRCGQGCQSSSTSPAIVYFPRGTYRLGSTIIQYYYTQLVGDAGDPPTLIADANMNGNFVIDSDPYDSQGNWWQNQNNFFRQVRNFIIDVTRCPPSKPCTGVHWQVAQATSITNVQFFMGTDAASTHQGIWMENGSGGFISDLIFNGGKFGIWVGNQQFTSRNLTFNGSQTAIYMNWNWGWTFKTIIINNCQIGLDMTSGGPADQTVGSIVLMDAILTNVRIGILTTTSPLSIPKASGSLILDNVKMSNVKYGVVNPEGHVILSGGFNLISSWGQGDLYTNGTTQNRMQGSLPNVNKPAVLLKKDGSFFERPRPQYQDNSVSDFVNVKDVGCRGDGSSDDTKCIQNALDSNSNSKILFFPAGVYIVSQTINVPSGSRLVGETWSVIMATGSYFGDMKNPQPMLKIGKKGETGTAEFSDFLFSTKGPVPGAILVEWNLKDPQNSPGSNGMWDCHFRVGGADGTQLQAYNCQAGSSPSPQCMGAFMMMHLTYESSAYLENVWAWTADHDLDGNHNQVSIYTGRGILVESQGPVWMYGTACEHNVMYQYSIVDAKNILMAMIQTETPYYQPSPIAPLPFVENSAFYDPDFSGCAMAECAMAWGLRIVNSSSVFVYGAGHYSFFDDYTQDCLKTENCQQNMVQISQLESVSEVYVYNLNTKAATNMVVTDKGNILQAQNPNGFCQTIVGNLWN